MTREQQELVEKNHNLIYSFLQKYNLSIEEYYDLAAIGLCKAAISFIPGKAQFSTYAYHCMFTTVMVEKRKDHAFSRIPEGLITYYQAKFDEDSDNDTNSLINMIPSKEDVEGDVLSEIIFDEYEKKLKERDRKIFSLFRQGYKQKEIGKLLGCSQAQVSKVKKKLCTYLAQ